MTKRDGGTGAGKLGSLTGRGKGTEQTSNNGKPFPPPGAGEKAYRSPMQDGTGNLLEAEAREGQEQAGTEPPGVPVLSCNN